MSVQVVHLQKLQPAYLRVIYDRFSTLRKIRYQTPPYSNKIRIKL